VLSLDSALNFVGANNASGIEGGPILEGTEGLLFCVLAVVLLFPMIMERLRIPGLIGLILGGYLIGSGGFNLIDEEGLRGLGKVGLLYLMFLAGLELDLGLFARNKGSGIRFGLLTFAIPFSLGIAAGVWIGLDGWALVLIGSVWASHTLVTYPTVQRRGLVSSRGVVVAVGATVITDTLALLVLAVVSGGDQSEGSNPLIPLGGGLLAVGLFTLWVLPRAARFWFRGQGQNRASRFIFVFAAFLAAALLAEFFGLEGIVGAFFAGLGLNRSVPNGSPLMEKVEFVGNALFIPFFLISIGLLIEPSVIFQVRTLQVAAAFALAVLIGKAIAAAIAGKLGGFSVAETGLMFSLTLPQAAATLAAAAVGLDLGLFDDVVLNAVLVVVLLSLLVSSATTEVFARRVPVPRGDDRPMGERVLVGVADDAQAKMLLPVATAVAQSDGGTVSPIHVIASEVTPVTVAPDGMKASLEGAVAAAGAEGEAHIRLDQSTALGLRNAAIEMDASVMIVGNRWRSGLSGWFRDRAVEQVVSASPVPVIVLIDPPKVKRIVVPISKTETLETSLVDVELLASLTTRLRSQMKCKVLVVAGPNVTDERLAVFTDSSIEHVRESPPEWVTANVVAGDLVVGASGSGIAVVDHVYNKIASTDDVGLAIVAGPGQAGTGYAVGVPSPFIDE